MSNIFLDFFKEPAPKDPIKDAKKIDRMYSIYSGQVFFACFCAYLIANIGFDNFSTAFESTHSSSSISILQADQLLLFISSISGFIYAFGKFFNGLLIAKLNTRNFISLAFILVAICNFGFAFLSNFTDTEWIPMLIFCAFNNLFLSMIYPCIIKSLSFWFSDSLRGKIIAIIFATHQIIYRVACAVEYWLVGFSWKWAFYIPGFIFALMGICLFGLMCNKPVTLGLPDVEEYKCERKKNIDHDGEKHGFFQTFGKSVLFNPVIWLLILSRAAINLSKIGDSSLFISSHLIRGSLMETMFKLEIANLIGPFGAVVGILISDKFFKSRRAPVNLFFLVTLSVSLFLFVINPSQTVTLGVIYISIAFFCIASLKIMMTVCIIESCERDIAAAAYGFAGIFSYFISFFNTFTKSFMAYEYAINPSLLFILWGICIFIAMVLNFILVPMEKKNKGIA